MMKEKIETENRVYAITSCHKIVDFYKNNLQFLRITKIIFIILNMMRWENIPYVVK